MARVPAPWLLKPRSQASGIGMKKIHESAELWPWLDQLGDDAIPLFAGTIHSRQRLSCGQRGLRSAKSSLRKPTRTALLRSKPRIKAACSPRAPCRAILTDVKTLLEMNRKVLEELGFLRGVTHAEFLRAHSDGKFYFLEVAARVGGAYISDVIEAATGINLWREWARLEVGAGKQPYQLPPTSARLRWSDRFARSPGTSRHFRVQRSRNRLPHHQIPPRRFCPQIAHARADRRNFWTLYSKRFQADFLATQPVPEKPSN